MKKTKYFIMGFIFLLFLNSCGYLQYAYEQAVVAAGGTPSTYNAGEADYYGKDGANAIKNPKYREKIKLLLKDIANRELTQEYFYSYNGKEKVLLWLPKGIVLSKKKNNEYRGNFKDEKTGYGLPLSINYKTTCPSVALEMDYKGLKLISGSVKDNNYIYMYMYTYNVNNADMDKLIKKIKEKNGFTHNCKDGKFE